MFIFLDVKYIVQIYAHLFMLNEILDHVALVASCFYHFYLTEKCMKLFPNNAINQFFYCYNYCNIFS